MRDDANACRTPEYRAGDEVMFTHEGLLTGRVERVTFAGRKARYEVRATLTFDVPESCVVGLCEDVVGKVGEKGGR